MYLWSWGRGVVVCWLPTMPRPFPSAETKPYCPSSPTDSLAVDRRPVCHPPERVGLNPPGPKWLPALLWSSMATLQFHQFTPAGVVVAPQRKAG